LALAYPSSKSFLSLIRINLYGPVSGYEIPETAHAYKLQKRMISLPLPCVEALERLVKFYKAKFECYGKVDPKILAAKGKKAPGKTEE